MKAKLKSLDLGSHIALDEYRPENSECFGFWLTASIGSDIDNGADNFQIFVCNRKWLEKESNSKGIDLDCHILIENGYDLDLISATLNDHIENCEGDNWMEIVEQLSKFGVWEFADYKM